MRVVGGRMAYRAAKSRRVSAYQAQYFWHISHRRSAAADSWARGILLPGAAMLRWVALAGLLVAGAVVVAALAAVCYVGVELVMIICG